MSYQYWHSPNDDENLRCWILSVTTKLVVEKRYEDVAQLMLVINDFESLSSMPAIEKDIKGSEFISITISALASSLSQIKWDKGTTDQDVYMILQDFSDFVQLNKLNSEAVYSINEPQKFFIPDSVEPRISLNF
jgi:hypothetical protein